MENLPNGEGLYWARQEQARLEGCQPQTLQALEYLARWTYNRTGLQLIVTAGTNGTSHTEGEYSHYNGWKLDVNTYGGTNGTSDLLNDDPQIQQEFIDYAHSLGLGCVAENQGTSNAHIDVQCGGDGFDWGDGKSYGGFSTPSTPTYNVTNTGTSTGSITGTSTTTGYHGPISDIIDFASFVQTKAFESEMTQTFSQSMQDTLHTYLSKFMTKFYHNIYYIPTLPDNLTIVVKPECCFIEPPACNVIYPTLKNSISYARDPKSEPTRIMAISDPISYMFGGASTSLTQLITMAFLDEEETKNSDGTTTTVPKVVSLNAIKNAFDVKLDLKHPQYNLTTFEKKYGIRILKDARGEDLYLFLASKGKTNGKKPTYVYARSNMTEICKTLERLAKYSLLRARYDPRRGSCEMYFNPYIVPGFPMLSIEGSATSTLNIYAYVTSVTHNITDNGWGTTISFSDTHLTSEPRPDAFPIAEAEYTETIDTTYKNLLGAAMTKIDKSSGPATCRDAYNNSDKTTLSMLKKVWRPLTTREQHLKDICDGATVVEDTKYTWFKNGSGKSFFDESIQAKIKTYTEKIFDGEAMSTADVR